eukprot:Skav232346  [mRNA]  locus=scaffold2646:130896:133349:+ [translate_table: standard]
MSPNLSRSKTEILLAIQGRGSRALRTKYHGPQQNHQLVAVGEHGCYAINVVGEYLHLGGLITHKKDNRKEARRRLAIAHQAFNQHRKLLYNNKQLSLKRRYEMFQMLIVSKLTYGMETWTLDDQRTKAYVHSAVIKLYRRLLGLPHDAHMADDDVVAALEAPTPTEVLRRARLRYVGSLYRCGDAAQWHLLRQDVDWIQLVSSDMRWMWHQLGENSVLPDPDVDLTAWEQLWWHSPGHWKRLVNRAVLHAILQRKNALVVKQMHVSVLGELQRVGIVETVPAPSVPHQPDVFGCIGCGVRCRNKAGERAHMFRVHGHRAEVCRLFNTTHCPSCLKEFHTFGKMKAHLLYSTHCSDDLRGRRMFVTPAPGIGSSAHRAQEAAHDGLLPVQQASGPRLPPGPARVQLDYDPELRDRFLTILLDHADLEDPRDLQPVCIAGLRGFAAAWTSFTSTLRGTPSTLSTEDYDMVNLVELDLRNLVEVLCDPLHWFPDTAPLDPEPLHQQPLWRLEELASQAARSTWCPPLRPPLGLDRFILHAFSGRRRRGDVQWFIERLTLPHGCRVHMVSMDIIINKEWGDATSSQTKDFWFAALRTRQVVGVLAGPPCNTFSKAREHVLGPGARAPRVVRAAEAPWGKEILRIGELMAVLTGNQLLAFALEALTLAALSGTCGMLGHPEMPEQETSVSIWRLPVVVALQELIGVETIGLCQGLFGASSAKPTRLMLVNLPSMTRHLHRWRLTDSLPWSVSIGRDQSTGAFKTAPLKEYPPSFCAAIAAAFCDSLAEFSLGPQSLDPDLKARCLNMVSVDYGDYIGPDFAG